jgi:hypothetical protein
VPAEPEQHAPASDGTDSPADSEATVIDAVPTAQPSGDRVAEPHEITDADGPDAAEQAPATEPEALAAESSEDAFEPADAQPGVPGAAGGDTTETDTDAADVAPADAAPADAAPADAAPADAAPAEVAPADVEGESDASGGSDVEPAEQPETAADELQPEISTGPEVEAEGAAEIHAPESEPVADEARPFEEPEPGQGDATDDGDGAVRADASPEAEESETDESPASDRDGDDRRHDA